MSSRSGDGNDLTVIGERKSCEEEEEEDDNHLVDNEDDAWGKDPEWVVEDDPEYSRDNVNDDDNDNDNDVTTDQSFGARHVLVLVDCRASPHAFRVAADACEALVRSQLRYVATSPRWGGRRDGIGVLLFDTRPFRGSDDYGYGYDVSDKVVYTLLNLEPPGTAQVRRLQQFFEPNGHGHGHGHTNDETNVHVKFSQNGNQEEDTVDRYYRGNDDNENVGDGADNDDNMSTNALASELHAANRAFRDAKCVKKTAKQQSRRDSMTIWIFTDRDDPCCGNQEEAKKVQVMAKDVKENGIQLRLFPLPTTFSKQFDSSVFYDNIATSVRRRGTIQHDSANDSDNDDEYHDMVAAEFVESIGRRVWKRPPSQRRLFTLPFCLREPSNVLFRMDFYRELSLPRKPRSVLLNPVDGRVPVRSKTQSIVADTGELLPSTNANANANANANVNKTNHRVRTYMTYAGRYRVPMTRDEIHRIRAESAVLCSSSSLSSSSSPPHNNGNGSCLVLAGFLPEDRLDPPFLIHTDRSYLARPSFHHCYAAEEGGGGGREGSDHDVQETQRKIAVAFATLHASMVRRRVVGIGEMLVTRRPAHGSSSSLLSSSVPRLVAVYPQTWSSTRNQEEENDDDDDDNDGDDYDDNNNYYKNDTCDYKSDTKGAIKRCGFLVSLLPYRDDLRSPKPPGPAKMRHHDHVVRPNEATIEAACEVIRHQQRTDNRIEWGRDYTNPRLRTFWNYVESVALGDGSHKTNGSDNDNDNDNDIDDDHDDTALQARDVLQAAGPQLEAFQRAVRTQALLEQKKPFPVTSLVPWSTDSVDQGKMDEGRTKEVPPPREETYVGGEESDQKVKMEDNDNDNDNDDVTQKPSRKRQKCHEHCDF